MDEYSIQVLLRRLRQREDFYLFFLKRRVTVVRSSFDEMTEEDSDPKPLGDGDRKSLEVCHKQFYLPFYHLIDVLHSAATGRFVARLHVHYQYIRIRAHLRHSIAPNCGGSVRNNDQDGVPQEDRKRAYVVEQVTWLN